MSGGKSQTHEDKIMALVGGVLDGIKCTGVYENSDWREIMSNLRYYRRLGQRYAQ